MTSMRGACTAFYASLALATTSVLSCAPRVSDDALVGTWQAVFSSVDKFGVVFNADGSGYRYEAGPKGYLGKVGFTWSANGGELRVRSYDEEGNLGVERVYKYALPKPQKLHIEPPPLSQANATEFDRMTSAH